MQIRIAQVILTACFFGSTLQAQTLSVDPARFGDPRPGTQARHGEVVLGQTTLTGALRMFAVELSSEIVSVPRGHPGNPSSYPPGTVWRVGSHEIHPRQSLDLGPERYTLTFDENDRLVSALTRHVPSGLTQASLLEHYPGIQKQVRWHSGDQGFDEWTAQLEPCVTLSAHLTVPTGMVEQLSYLYTCETKALRR